VDLVLEEDVDMRGLMGGDEGKEGKREGEGVHSNVEQLMRIADLLRDGRRVVGLPVRVFALWGC
jgi:hypothetical protein